ncbi:MAG: hypothetical protein A2751_04915 [Candidatus Doudnabacteria bacterium RIFCSPHIGHO2_01_FULL_46_14]|uniref:Uncharacterized protein n=1 Tax=Candidatus Doudnabacteria bacterium RIFCSPHIGHO2_01_FULL_46_14 TaxID=1817824 RepID=A0A1F5NP53_9BACT|nr:MAG: hypothetical protein A2751_04915 [Candidatus Doudnabacteria bacterium RIFCSPHIGHO2_01_FULL_46_14]
MNHIIDPSKHKLVIVSVATLVSFFGFQAASQALDAYQLEKFWLISFYVYIFLVFWQSFVFDLHLRGDFLKSLKHRFAYMFDRGHLSHYINYLILSAVIYWATAALLYLNPFEIAVKQALSLVGAGAFALSFWYLKTVFYGHKQAHRGVRQSIFFLKLYASFISFAAVFGLGHYYGITPFVFAIMVFVLTYLLIHQAFFQHHYLGHNEIGLILLSGLATAEFAAIIYFIWNVNYYSGALVICALYNTIWGILQHKYIDKNLNREIIYEYFAVLFVVLVIIFSTTNFSEKLPPPDQNRYENNQHQVE